MLIKANVRVDAQVNSADVVDKLFRNWKASVPEVSDEDAWIDEGMWVVDNGKHRGGIKKVRRVEADELNMYKSFTEIIEFAQKYELKRVTG